MREGKRARDEGREIFKGRPFRALWAMRRSQRAFTLSGTEATEQLGADRDVTWVLAAFLAAKARREYVFMGGGEGRREGRLLQWSEQTADGGSRDSERWSGSGNLWKVEPADRSGVGA